MSSMRVFLGVGLAAVVAIVVSVALSPPARAAEDPVSVWDNSGDGPPKRCSAIDARDPFEVRGGCRVKAHGGETDDGRETIALNVGTVVGDLKFAKCGLAYDLRIDGSGRTLLERPKFPGESPCNDVLGCFNAFTMLPMHGQIYADGDGQLHHRIEFCVDSCMGRFKGPMVTQLRPTRKGWRVQALNAAVGESGLSFDGHWGMTAHGVEIRGER